MDNMCSYQNCTRKARYFMGWIDNNGEKHWGMVCCKHDRLLGRRNLRQLAGMSVDEAIEFERYPDGREATISST